MQRFISLKPISSSSVSPQRQKRIRAEKSYALPRHNLSFLHLYHKTPISLSRRNNATSSFQQPAPVAREQESARFHRA